MSRNTHPGHHRGGMCGVRHCPGCSGKNFADISKRCYVCHYMFVRFRQSANRLQLSLVESCRVGVKVRHEHVASLGAIGMSPSVADRVAFWGRLHERLAKLSNRVDPKAQTKIFESVHAKIPLPTIAEQRGLQLENAKADERIWTHLRELHEEQVEGQQKLVETAKTAIGENQSAAANAAAHAAAMSERIGRIEKGEAVPGGLGKTVTIEDAIAELGWTPSDVRHARRLSILHEIGADDDYQEAVFKHNRRAEKALSRSILRKHLFR
jgi:hypothetical protein